MTDLRVVCLHPDNAFEPFVLHVPAFSEKMDRLMLWRRQNHGTRLHVSASAEDAVRAGTPLERLPYATHSALVRQRFEVNALPRLLVFISRA